MSEKKCFVSPVPASNSDQTKNNVWFDEKARQITGKITAFGINISSRYDKVSDIVTLLDFAVSVALKGLESTIDSLFFESKSDTINITLKQGTNRNKFDCICELAQEKLTDCCMLFVFADGFDTFEHNTNHGCF